MFASDNHRPFILSSLIITWNGLNTTKGHFYDGAKRGVKAYFDVSRNISFILSPINAENFVRRGNTFPVPGTKNSPEPGRKMFICRVWGGGEVYVRAGYTGNCAYFVGKLMGLKEAIASRVRSGHYWLAFCNFAAILWAERRVGRNCYLIGN